MPSRNVRLRIANIAIMILRTRRRMASSVSLQTDPYFDRPSKFWHGNRPQGPSFFQATDIDDGHWFPLGSTPSP